MFIEGDIMNFRKRLLKESNTQALSGPKVGPESGVAAMLIDAINGEWETINEYNSIALMAREEGMNDIASVIDEINTEENKHVGQLQELLKLVSPNANAISEGEAEAREQVDDDVSWYEDK